MSLLRICQRIKADGIRCGAIAMKHERFCYFHVKDRAQKNRLRRAGRIRLRSYLAGPSEAQCREDALPRLDSATAIANILNDIIASLWLGHLDPDTAGKMLFAIQLSQKAPRVRLPAPQSSGFSPKVEAPGFSPVNNDEKEAGFSPGAEALNNLDLNAGMNPRSSTEDKPPELSPEQRQRLLSLAARYDPKTMTSPTVDDIQSALDEFDEIMR